AMFLGSAAEFAQRYVQTPVLQAAVATDGIIGTFAGPRDPGTGYVLAHHYAGYAFGIQGAWGYVRGGMGTISNAIAASARARGAQIRTEAAVSGVTVRDHRATGVVLEDGSELEADAILSNAAPKTSFLRLLPAGTLDAAFTTRVQAWKDEGPVVKLNLALGELPVFTARPMREAGPWHNATIHIAPDIDYIQRAFEDAARGLPSDQPFLEMYLQSPNDASIAPPGKHLLSIFSQYFPYQRADGEWTDAKKKAAADSILGVLAQYAPNVTDAIEGMQLFTPPDLERRFNLPRGHIFHGELLPGQIFEHRFASATPLAGFYLCGSGAHPGGCVSGIPGWRAARALLRDRELAVSQAQARPATSSATFR
ncbi:MAG: NAD(P)/FAD-dependent oxidoreductase, partial [Candidatus Eremiobacteraeota bacterium]|nr:NAD(P)/FAD-dependent oxidoreductase [Candidatus Eremiobacteraeota bacterium]